MVCCRLVSRSAVGLDEKWNGRIVFGDVMQSERGFFTTKTWGGGVLNCFCIIRGKCFAMFVAIKKSGVKKNARIFVEKVPCFNVEQIDNGC